MDQQLEGLDANSIDGGSFPHLSPLARSRFARAQGRPAAADALLVEAHRRFLVRSAELPETGQAAYARSPLSALLLAECERAGVSSDSERAVAS